MTQERQPNTQAVNWKQVAAFLGLTFGLTYLLDLILYLAGGLRQNAPAAALVQVQMLIPATVAIVLQMFVFKNSPIHRLQELPRWFFYFYLGFALFFVAVSVSVWLVPNQLFQTIISLLTQLLMVVGLVLAIVLRLASGKEAFHRARLGGGKLWHYLLFGSLVILVLCVSVGLDTLFGLGQAVDVKEFLAQAAGGQSAELGAIPDLALLLLVGAQTIILGPVLGLLIAFGEEFGWRGYLQGELTKMGKVRGILLVGVIWGLWHAPIIAMGHNYPGHPVLGMLLMTLMTVAWAFVLGYAVMKSQSVWLAAFLHALLNQTASFLILMIYRPADTVFSFTIGLYGLAVWAVVVGALLVLDRRQWTTPVEPELVEAPN
jgi:membrane protease YdiL (CAAX protease family)